MIRRVLLVAATPVVAVAAPTHANPPVAPSAKLSDLDTQMIAHQHAVNQTEIALGKLAESHGTAAVKKYGAMLIKDHGQADRNITTLAKKKGVTAIPEDMALTEDKSAERRTRSSAGGDAKVDDKKDLADKEAKLKGLKGADFDRMFLDMMANGHEREVTKIEADIAVVSDPDLKAMLQKIEPTLRHHEEAAKALQKTVTSRLEN